MYKALKVLKDIISTLKDIKYPPEIKLVRRLGNAVALYRPSENTIYISVEYIMEIMEKTKDGIAYCEVLSILAHELQHYIDINIHHIYDKRELEKNALLEELKVFKECIDSLHAIHF